MEYTELYLFLKSVFATDNCESKVFETGIKIHCYPFTSDFDHSFCGSLYPSTNDDIFSGPDSESDVNRNFRYMVFDPGCSEKYESAILLMHGLNERFWTKYLPWAYEMALSLKRPVILFPFAFHLNRSPESWSNRTILSNLLPVRQQQTDDYNTTTIANLALSNRLTRYPIRYLTSGKQSADDIVKLLASIQNGEHELFTKGAKTDIFAYSIGGYLAQVLFYSSRKVLFDNSKMFLFCAGSYFDEMYGVSRVIMDKTAFDRMHYYYTHELNNDCERNLSLNNYLKYNDMGIAFYAMLSKNFNYNFNRNINAQLGNRILAYILSNDKVIPVGAIRNALNNNVAIIEDHFPFEYIHENPFPIYNEKEKAELVDQAFTKVFNEVKEFFAA